MIKTYFYLPCLLLYAHTSIISRMLCHIDPKNSIMYVSMDYIQLGFMVGIFFLFGRYHIIWGKESGTSKYTVEGSERISVEICEMSLHMRIQRTKSHDLKHHFTVLQSKIKEDPEYALNMLNS